LKVISFLSGLCVQTCSTIALGGAGSLANAAGNFAGGMMQGFTAGQQDDDKQSSDQNEPASKPYGRAALGKASSAMPSAEARDGLTTDQVDVLAMGPTRDAYGELESGVSGEPADLIAIRRVLSTIGIPEPHIDELLLLVLQNQIDAAMDQPPTYRGQPMPGGKVRAMDEDALLKQVTNDLSASVRVADTLVGMIGGYGGRIAGDEAFRLAQRVRRYAHLVALKGGIAEDRAAAFAAEFPDVARIATDAGYDAGSRYRLPAPPEPVYRARALCDDGSSDFARDCPFATSIEVI
jgi:hypothetical protein